MSPKPDRRSSKAPRRFGGELGVDPRATLERERGAIVKNHAGKLRVALAFPNSYFVGMSNLGLQTVYRLFNEHERVVCERVFLPTKDRARGSENPQVLANRQPLVTIESQTPVSDFDIFAFSVSFEWDYTNVVSMLRMA